MLKVRELRKARGWTISELARRAGCARPFLSRIEAGNANPTQTILEKIAGALGVPVSQLFDEPSSSAKKSAVQG